MTPEEKYELLKKDFILKSESHLKMLETLALTSFEQVGRKGDLANSHQEAITSYTKLL